MSALAESFVADQDGSLPILFDDAYTVPTRTQFLQRMLDLAAVRDL